MPDSDSLGDGELLGFWDGLLDSTGFGFTDGSGFGFGTTGVSSFGTTTSGLLLVSSRSRTGGVLPPPFGALPAFTVNRDESIIA
ncbi:hypothetical protein GCM10009614_33790 [Glutamicibacter uratoxydans]